MMMDTQSYLEQELAMKIMTKPPSATTNFISDFYGRVPYDPDFHKQIRGTLTIGYGTTFDGKPGKQDLFNQVYTDGIAIGGTTYIFPCLLYTSPSPRDRG